MVSKKYQIGLLNEIFHWAFKWYMSFDPNPAKQTKGIILSRKVVKPLHPVIKFNNIPVQNTSFQKHFGLFLTNNLNFKHSIIYKREDEKIQRQNGCSERATEYFAKESPNNNL